MRSLAVFTLALGLLVAEGRVGAQQHEQAIEPLAPPVEQRVEAVGGADQQRVEMVEPAEEQTVGAHEPPTPAAKAASRAGKILIGVTAAVLALGATAAQLLLL